MSWTEVFRAKASIYALHEQTKQWTDRGTSGVCVMYWNSKHQNDVRIKWEKNGREFWWRLMASKLKAKGERAVVLKAWSSALNQQEILAIRFADQKSAVYFSQKYRTIFPPQSRSPDAQPQQPQQPPPLHPHPQQQHQHQPQRSQQYQYQSRHLPAQQSPQQQHQHYYQASLPSSSHLQQHQHQYQHRQQQQQPQSPAQPLSPYYYNQDQHEQQQQQQQQHHQPPPQQQQMPYNNEAQYYEPPPQQQQPQQHPQQQRMPGDIYNSGGGSSHVDGDASMQELAPKAKWRCAVCTYFNEVAKMRCNMCGLPKHKQRESQKLKKQQQQQSWNCHKCTYSNPSYEIRCAVCGALNNNASSNERLLENSWECPTCTLLNGNENLNCRACDTLRRHAIASANANANANPHPNGGAGGGGATMMKQRISAFGNGMMKHSNMFEELSMMRMQYENARLNGIGIGGGGGGASAMHDGIGIGNGVLGGGGGGAQRRKVTSTEADFLRAASDIACYNDTPANIFSTLRSVAKKLLKSDIRYRTLDTTNPKVMERLIGFEGVLDFLVLLGFESDAMGMKLIAEVQPSPKVVRNAINVLNTYQSRFVNTAGAGAGAGTGAAVIQAGNGGNNSGGGAHGINQNGNVNQNHNHNHNNHNTGNNMSMNMGNNVIGGTGAKASVEDEHELSEEELLGDSSQMTTQGFGDGCNDNDTEDNLTLEQIILWSTHENQNNDLMDILILTHKTFTESVTLLRCLRRRFFVPIPNDMIGNFAETKAFQVTIQKRIQLKVIKALRHWMRDYFDIEFAASAQMLFEMRAWLTELKEYSTQSESYCIWVLPLYDTVKKEFLRFQQKGNQYQSRCRPNAQPLKNFEHVVIPKKVTITQYTADLKIPILADQLTLMAFRIFSRITDRELLEQHWKNDKNFDDSLNNDLRNENVIQMINLFNSLTIFVQIQILREKNLLKRSKAIKRVIKMGERFRALRNFNSLCAVFGALNSAAIHRLKLAWKRVPEKALEEFQEWAIIFCCNRNHRNLRQLIRKHPGRPCIPHLGVFLQDLIFIDEGNSRYVSNLNINSSAAAQKKKMINFSKCVRIADRIKSIKMYQMQSYELKENEILQKVLLNEFRNLKGVTEDEIWDMSTEIKRSDQREANKGIFNRN